VRRSSPILPTERHCGSQPPTIVSDAATNAATGGHDRLQTALRLLAMAEALSASATAVGAAVAFGGEDW